MLNSQELYQQVSHLPSATAPCVALPPASMQSSLEKLRLAELLLADLDAPNPEIDAIWREEAQKRWQAYKVGELKTVSSANCSCIALPPASMQSYEAVMQKYK